MELNTDAAVKEKFDQYPPHVRPKLDVLRDLILEVAREEASVSALHETLKWGEPSYIAKHGSTVRINWNSKKPEQVGIYFKCTSKLVLTFRAVYGDLFNYEKNRAIIFGLEDEIPVEALKHCVAMALNYHKIKHLALLGN